MVGENGWSKCTLRDGDRIFGDYNEGGVRGKTPYILDRFDLEYMKEFDFVHTGNYCYTESQLKVMKEAGIKFPSIFLMTLPKNIMKNMPIHYICICSFDGDDEAAKRTSEIYSFPGTGVGISYQRF